MLSSASAQPFFRIPRRSVSSDEKRREERKVGRRPVGWARKDASLLPLENSDLKHLMWCSLNLRLANVAISRLVGEGPFFPSVRNETFGRR
jgi:hypothetical protein